MPTFRSLQSKFAIGASLILVLIFLSQTIINIRSTESKLRDGVNQEVKAFSQLASRSFVETYSRYYPSGFGKFKEILNGIWTLSPNVVRIRLIDMEGRIRFDTEELEIKELSDLEMISPSLLERIRRPDPYYIYEDEGKSAIDQIIYPFIDEWGRHEYSFIYTVSYKILEKEINQAIIRTALLAILLLVLSIALVGFLTVRITGPLSELREGTNIVGKGNLDYKLKIRTGDEIEQLAEEFNKMTERLKESIGKLEEAKESLEVKVKERTKELQERIDELEKFHKVTVGRELKMTELKDEIEKLRKELVRYKQNK